MSMKENDVVVFEVVCCDNGFLIVLPQSRKRYVAHSHEAVMGILNDIVRKPPPVAPVHVPQQV